MSEHHYRVAIVGATGVVGHEALKILEDRGHPTHQIVAMGSDRSSGTPIPYADGEISVTRAVPDAFVDVEIALFCADSTTARELAPAAAAQGVTVIDNSSAFRMGAGIPLVIPEVNGRGVDFSRSGQIIANPNCSTIIMLVALGPIHRAFGLKQVVVSTYQAVSGAGRSGIVALRGETASVAAGHRPAPSHFPEPCAMNVFTHESDLDPHSGLNGEELKMIHESRKILGDTQLRILPTCVRVPVERVHSQSITARLHRHATREAIESVLGETSAIDLWPRNGPRHPTPLGASGTDRVSVGRVRVESTDQGCDVSLWVCGDQLRKGAALNAIQVADLVWSRRLSGSDASPARFAPQTKQV
ncbi:MAG: aspartate-semialdehyde dehydrogenase [Phycisphaerales bacterium]